VSATDFSAMRRRAESRKGGAPESFADPALNPPVTHLRHVDRYDADTILKRMNGDE
jgi:hypothetical protein